MFWLKAVVTGLH